MKNHLYYDRKSFRETKINAHRALMQGSLQLQNDGVMAGGIVQIRAVHIFMVMCVNLFGDGQWLQTIGRRGFRLK